MGLFLVVPFNSTFSPAKENKNSLIRKENVGLSKAGGGKKVRGRGTQESEGGLLEFEWARSGDMLKHHPNAAVSGVGAC